MQPKLALTQRIAELAGRIYEANNLLRAALNHDFETVFTSDKDHENAFATAQKAYSKIRSNIKSEDFDRFENEVGSGKPQTLQDVRGKMENNFTPTAPTPVGTARRMFMEKRIEIMNNADAVDKYAFACLHQAEIFIAKWNRES
jgi:hypothetical protein